MKITILFLSYKRTQNVLPIINSITRNFVSEIIIFNNDPSYQLKSDVATIINSNKNLGCFVKYTIGQLARTKYCLLIDDDIMLQPNTVKNFIDWSAKYPESILGYFGMNLSKYPDAPYSEGDRVHTKDLEKPKEVDIVLGRMHFFKTTKLADAISHRNRIENYFDKDHLWFEGEDIVLSMMNKHKGYKNYIIPSIPDGGYINLEEQEVALSKRGNHMASRNRTVLEISKLK